jgi:hypothetical protein
VKPLSDEDNVIMQDLHKVLKKHNALKRFGITLLHEHFKVEDDEVLIEFTDIATRTQVIKPVSQNDPELIDAIETSWRLDTGFPVMGCKCKKYGTGDHSHYPSN